MVNLCFFSDDCDYDELLCIIHEFIPILFNLWILFVFIAIMHEIHGKSKGLYRFMAAALCIFDLLTFGFNANYFAVLDKIITDTELY